MTSSGRHSKNTQNSGAEKNEEIISSNCLPHHKRASSFTNKHEATRLHLLPKLSRYIRISERVQHDVWCSSLHERWCLLYEVQCTSLHTEGLRHPEPLPEQRKVTTVKVMIQCSPAQFITRFSTLSRLQRVAGYCLRFLHNATTPSLRRTGYLTRTELRDALQPALR